MLQISGKAIQTLSPPSSWHDMWVSIPAIHISRTSGAIPSPCRRCTTGSVGVESACWKSAASASRSSSSKGPARSRPDSGRRGRGRAVAGTDARPAANIRPMRASDQAYALAGDSRPARPTAIARRSFACDAPPQSSSSFRFTVRCSRRIGFRFGASEQLPEERRETDSYCNDRRCESLCPTAGVRRRLRSRRLDRRRTMDR